MHFQSMPPSVSKWMLLATINLNFTAFLRHQGHHHHYLPPFRSFQFSSFASALATFPTSTSRKGTSSSSSFTSLRLVSAHQDQTAYTHPGFKRSTSSLATSNSGDLYNRMSMSSSSLATTSTSKQEEDLTSNDTSGDNDNDNDREESKIHTHYVFLVHGWLGNSSEMAYVETSINRAVDMYKTNPNPVNENDNANDNDSSSSRCETRIVTHSAVCNDSRTDDGIVPGGKRLADEIVSFIRNDQDQDLQDGDNDGENKIRQSGSGSILGLESGISSEKNGGDGDSNGDGSDDEDGLSYGDSDDALSLDAMDEDENENDKDSVIARGNDNDDMSIDEDNDDDEDMIRHVTISFVGNSLGGLYARYALSLLPTNFTLKEDEKEDSNSSQMQMSGSYDPVILDQAKRTRTRTRIHVHYNIFATTATPHLGVASHTFLPIPRVAERAIGGILKQTGRDLFRLDKDDLIYQMSTDYVNFLKPLGMFRRRIAYANAFRTDFQVPTSTAAFLSKHNTYPHCIQPSNGGDSSNGRIRTTDPNSPSAGDEQNKEDNKSKNPFLVAIATTKRDEQVLQEGGKSKCQKHTMSVKLDSLGWEKVFVDVRDYIPIPAFGLPSNTKTNRGSKTRRKWDKFIEEYELCRSELESEPTGKPKRNVSGSSSASEQGLIVVDSSLLEKYMTGSDRFHVPVGHQVMVVNSKSKSYSNLTKKGKPVMDYLANDMVTSILGRQWV
mmetsp:Transcript_19875/g.29257  ORF Transcript_19875/g.29257 Transcript_19875/m.29257 type:complete len:723 (+) Transcript_19875:74-2242(+)